MPLLFIIETWTPSGLESIETGQLVLLTIEAQLERNAQVIITNKNLDKLIFKMGRWKGADRFIYFFVLMAAKIIIQWLLKTDFGGIYWEVEKNQETALRFVFNQSFTIKIEEPLVVTLE